MDDDIKKIKPNLYLIDLSQRNCHEETIDSSPDGTPIKFQGNMVVRVVNPLVPSAHKSVRISKISILKLEGIIKKISYERRDYESVDEKGLS